MSVFVALFGGIVASFVIEQLVRPRPLLGSRHRRALAMHFGVWLLLFGVGLAIWQRPYFASGLNTAGMLLIVLVSNAKYASLREPFLLSDFRFFKALLRHPRLYLPFFGVLPAIGCAVFFVGLCIFALWIEPSLLAQVGTATLVAQVATLIALGGLLLLIGMRGSTPITLEPIRDLSALGLLGSFIRYWQEEKDNNPQTVAQRLQSGIHIQSKTATLPQLPHIVAVQCESFFDPRHGFKGISNEVLKNFDALTNVASQSGRLNVAAWGANTVRTEFAFLSGVPPSALGVHQFNPYRMLARHGVTTIASELKKQGYRTVCVHPFSGSFYDRDKVFPALGFDEFIDTRAFSNEERSGPYIGDLAVAKKVGSILEREDRPLFIFVITMENHGPLHQEKVAEGDHARLYAEVPPGGYDELTIFLRHLQHTDAMLGELFASLNATARKGWLCAYGDHVPILPGIYETTDFADGRTEYLVVGPSPVKGNPRILDIAPQDLAQTLLREAGILQGSAVI